MRKARSLALLLLVSGIAMPARGDGVFVRFKLEEPTNTRYFVRLAGYIHVPNWYLPRAVLPVGADRNADLRVPSGEFTPWFDLKKHAGKSLHGQLSRAGGAAEFPNVTVHFVTDAEAERRRVVIELATSPAEADVVKRFRESFRGELTSFLVSPQLSADAHLLETAAEMSERRLRWAKEATGGTRVSPKKHIIQTSLWSAQRPELNAKEGEVLWLLGFNVLGNQHAPIGEDFQFAQPGHSHGVPFGPATTRQVVEETWAQLAQRNPEGFAEGVPFGFCDEVCCRPRIEQNEQAIHHFHAWLAEREISARALGVAKLAEVVPIETPEAFREREKQNGPAARRVFYYTSRFRQQAATERLKWNTEAFHKHFGPGPLSSTLVADHPYFGGTGLGMGMVPNITWGGAPLAMDWFDLARRQAVDLIGIEDWMGLQYMYGPNSTWEGFQLMGFQASIFRSGSRGRLPIIAWITPSDETNLRLKSFSALCQGAKHFFYWTYGPTATSTENYWSDLRSAYDGIVHVTRSLAAAEHILAPGRVRKTKVALLYSISSDLWQPLGYVHMLERRGTYLSLVHDQYLVDMLTEEDVEAGRLEDYAVLYATDPCIRRQAAQRIAQWVRRGGHLYASCAAGCRDEFNEPSGVLAEVFGIAPEVAFEVQPGEYRVRGRLNQIPHFDRLIIPEDALTPEPQDFGVIGAHVRVRPKDARVLASFPDRKTPAVLHHVFGQGEVVYFATTPGISYIKDARFVPRELKESWPRPHRGTINAWSHRARAARLVELSHPVVEAGVYDAKEGSALVLANFTYRPIRPLEIVLPVNRRVRSVRSVTQGKLPFTQEDGRDRTYRWKIRCRVDLGLTDILLFE